MKLIITILMLTTIFNFSFANDTCNCDGPEIIFGATDESYPSGNDYFGNVPHSFGIFLGLKNDKEIRVRPLGTFYVEMSTAFKYEPQPEKYDEVRDPISNESKLEIVKPIAKDLLGLALDLRAGLKAQMNGPQYNDNYGLLFSGMGLQKETKVGDGMLELRSSVNYARYFYEVDDEPARRQTGTERIKLSHYGNGILGKASIEYLVDKNKYLVNFEILHGEDQKQGGDFKQKSISISAGRKLSKEIECEIEYSITDYEYNPVVLAHRDQIHASKVQCKKKF